MIVITRVVLYSVIFWPDLRGGHVGDGPSRSAEAGMLQISKEPQKDRNIHSKPPEAKKTGKKK
jgi:hypothetical protein